MRRVTWFIIYLVGLSSLACRHSFPDVSATPGANIQVDTLFSVYRPLTTAPYRQQTSVFLTTYGLAFDQFDNLYFTDINRNRIGRLTPDLRLSSLAGPGVLGDQDGPLDKASFVNPTDVKFDPNGRLTIATNHAIRQVQPDSTVKTIVSNETSKLLVGLFNITFDQAGNLYAVAWGGGSAIPTTWQERGAQVLKITPNHQIIPLVHQYKDASLQTKWFDQPRSLVVDSKGNLFIDAGYYGILRVTPQGTVTTFVSTPYYPQPTSAAAMSLNDISGLVIDKDDNLLFCSSPYLCKATPEGAVSILAGKPDGQDTGRGDQVSFGHIEGIALDSKGSLYLTNSFNTTIYRVKFNE